MKAEFNTTPTQYSSLGKNQKRSHLHPRRRALMLPKEPGEETKFDRIHKQAIRDCQKELDACKKTWEK